jgi:hypothetical protein
MCHSDRRHFVGNYAVTLCETTVAKSTNRYGISHSLEQSAHHMPHRGQPQNPLQLAESLKMQHLWQLTEL